ncbi:MAG TPA: hypothetical protein VKT81_10580 [Bryobacteraceae bacterium]|nr:hypothetical protein [Bryobacteraceae bacterium]
MSAKWGRWTRVVAPSFSDFFFVAIMAWLFICGASGWKSLLMDGDTGWHIRTGEYILANRSVPTHDLFSFSKPGAPWFAWEWLSDVVFGLLFRMGALKAIVLFSGVLIAVYATLLLRYAIWRGANALVAAALTFLAIGSASLHFLARPHLYTLVFLPAALWLIEVDRRNKTRWLWLLVPLTALWTNLHGGFLIFLVLLTLLVAGTMVEAWLGRPRWAAARRYALLLIACSAASFINPQGPGLHQHIVEYLRADWIRNLVQEFQAPTFRSEGQFQYEALLLIGVVVSGALLRRKCVSEALWILFLAHCSLISVRHVPIYATVAAPLIASELSGWWQRAAAERSKGSVLRILHQLGQDIIPSFRWLSIWPALVVLALIAIDQPIKWPTDFPTEAFPVAMVHQNAAFLQSGRLLTPDQWGDYLIYCYYPRQRVFVDGRSDFYGEALGKEYLHLLQGSYDWRAILKRHGFDRALLPVDWPLTAILKLDASWRVLQDDGKAILFQRMGQWTPAN